MEWPLHYACRIGDLDQVKYIVEIRRYPVNERDDFDRTPLYFAALTGRNDICQYLLENGAKCEPDSTGGDAARIFYVALTPELRRLLRYWSLSAKTQNPFYDYLRKSFNDPTYSDCVLLIHLDPINISITSNPNQAIHVHKIMIRYRCPMLANNLFEMEINDDSHNTTILSDPIDNKSTYNIVLKSSSEVEAMKLILEYFYTGSINISTFEMAIAVIELVTNYGLIQLLNSLEKTIDEFVLHSMNDNRKASADYCVSSALLSMQKDFGKQSFRCQLSEIEQLNQDMIKMASFVSIPHSEFTSYHHLNDVLRLSDVTILCTGDYTWSLNRFRICVQSGYLEGALHGGFKESSESLLDLTLVITNPETIRLAIQWMYCNQFIDQPSSIQVAMEILEFGFFILCPQLATFVANNFIASIVDAVNVWDILNMARLYQLERLEESCVDFVGTNFMSFYQSHQLREVLTEELVATKQSGDKNIVDIPIASEIKRAISKCTSLNLDQKSLSLETLRSLLSDIVVREVNMLL